MSLLFITKDTIFKYIKYVFLFIWFLKTIKRSKKRSEYTGNKNAGNKNAGNKNAGNKNAGNKNAGNKNAGNKNARNKNAGNKKSDYT